MKRLLFCVTTAIVVAVVVGMYYMATTIAELQSDVAYYQARESELERQVAGLSFRNEILHTELTSAVYALAESEQRQELMYETLRKLQATVYASPGWFKHVDITIPSLLSEEEIDALLYGTPLEGLGYVFVDLEREYELNAVVVIALINHETAFVRSTLSRAPYYNLFGWGAYDSNPMKYAWKFKDYEDSLRTVVPLIKAQYVEQRGLTTLARAGPRYATDPFWADKVANHVTYVSRGVFEGVRL